MDAASFDAQIESCLLRINEARRGPQGQWSPPDGRLDPWCGPDAPHHVVPLSPGRLTVLLGRNGSGKTMMLQSLSRVDERHNDFISSAFLFALPSEADDQEWTEWVNASHPAVPPLTDNAIATAPHRRIVERLVESVGGVWPGANIAELDLSARDLLLYFGLPEQEVEKWERRRAYFATDEKLRELHPEFGLRQMSAEYILRGATDLPHNTSGADTVPFWAKGTITSAHQWFNDSELRDLIAPATQQFFESMTHFVMVGQHHGRLLAPRPEQGPLRDFMEQQSLMVDQHQAMTLDEEGLLQSRAQIFPFPVALFRSFSVGGRPYIASFDLEVHREEIIEVVDLSPKDDERASDAAIRRLSTLALGMVTAHETDDEISLTYRGVKRLRHVLERVSDRLSRCNIGIAEVKLGWPPRGTRWISSGEVDNGFEWFLITNEGLPSEMMPTLKLRDAVSGDWFDLEDASRGQIETLALFLHLTVLRLDSLPPVQYRRSVLVCDEFDRSLHPAAGTAVLENLQEMASELDGVSVVVSTHNVAELGKPSLSGVSRVYAKRSLSEISFTDSLDSSLEVIAEVLGSTFLDALKLKRLHILVEGNHDEIVIGDVLRDQIPEIRDVDIVNGHGLYAWTGIIANSLRFLDAPILLVHDKRDEALEDQWMSVQDTFRQTGRLPDWGTTRFARMLGDLKQRRSKKKSLKSDGELEKLLFLLRDNVFERDQSLATRINIFGLECDDIVDLLPISAFLPKNRRVKSWKEAHDDFDERFPRAGGQHFKDEYGINDGTVRAALAANMDLIHDELVRLVGVVRSLLDGQPAR